LIIDKTISIVLQSAVIDDKTANDYKSEVLTPLKITKAVQYGLIVIGALLVLCAILFLVKIRLSDKVRCRVHVLSLYSLTWFVE